MLDKLTKRKNHNPLYGSRIYRCWSSMKDRCNNSNSNSFDRYGGRGISYTRRWEKFAGFFADMAMTYKDNLTLDRIDNNKGYSKKNCRWVTHKQNCNNKGNNTLITINGMTQTITQWAEEIGITPQTVHKRIKRGWSIERAITTKNLKK